MDAPNPQQDSTDEPTPRDERAGIYLAALAAFTVPILIVAAVLLTQNNDPEPLQPLEPATRSGLDRLEIEASELTIGGATESPIESSAPAEPDATISSSPQDDISGDAPEEATTDIAVELPSVAAEDVAVAVYNQAADEPGTYSFAIRLTSQPEIAEIDTAAFVISVVDADGKPVPSISRFEHETLPPDSSALALVRAEQVGAGAHYVLVTVGETELDRALIDEAS